MSTDSHAIWSFCKTGAWVVLAGLSVWVADAAVAHLPEVPSVAVAPMLPSGWGTFALFALFVASSRWWQLFVLAALVPFFDHALGRAVPGTLAAGAQSTTISMLACVPFAASFGWIRSAQTRTGRGIRAGL